MGKRGPKPTPKPILAQRGSRLAASRSSIAHIDGAVHCPAWLKGVSRKKWNELCPQLIAVEGLMLPAYIDALALYCEAFEEFMRARKKLASDAAYVAIGEKGGEYQSPWVGIKNRAIERLRKHGALFGLSPSEATRVSPDGGAGEGGQGGPAIDFFKMLQEARPN